jgi:hypothetical protein
LKRNTDDLKISIVKTRDEMNSRFTQLDDKLDDLNSNYMEQNENIPIDNIATISGQENILQKQTAIQGDVADTKNGVTELIGKFDDLENNYREQNESILIGKIAIINGQESILQKQAEVQGSIIDIKNQNSSGRWV